MGFASAQPILRLILSQTTLFKPGLREEAGLFRRGCQMGMEILPRMFHVRPKPRNEG
jgi:hypothetical protein